MPQHSDLPEATVVIGHSSSHCNACGKETLPPCSEWNDGTHDRISGYGPDQPGCGVRWTHVAAETGDEATARAWARDCAPGLTFVPFGFQTTAWNHSERAEPDDRKEPADG